MVSSQVSGTYGLSGSGVQGASILTDAQTGSGSSTCEDEGGVIGAYAGAGLPRSIEACGGNRVIGEDLGQVSSLRSRALSTLAVQRQQRSETRESCGGAVCVGSEPSGGGVRER